MKIKKNSKNHVFLNRNGEHIAGYLIHYKRKEKNQMKKQNNIELEQIEWNFQQSMSYNL
jgi:hypothetical protein